jgi:hypothetical protein
MLQWIFHLLFEEIIKRKQWEIPLQSARLCSDGGSLTFAQLGRYRAAEAATSSRLPAESWQTHGMALNGIQVTP